MTTNCQPQFLSEGPLRNDHYDFIYFLTAPYAVYGIRSLSLFIDNGLGLLVSSTHKQVIRFYPTLKNKRLLILSYSFSSQTRNLLGGLIDGLRQSEVDIHWEQLGPLADLRFPIGTIPSTLSMMLQTFLRKRYPVQAIHPVCFESYDLIIVAGPTWSYNPSGPVLSLIDRDGQRLFAGQTVLPFISCRGYWRVHYFGLKRLLQRCGAVVVAPIVFSHPTPEPWRTIGVFLKLAGKAPEAGSSWFRRFYPKYGHSRQQVEDSRRVGVKLGQILVAGGSLTTPLFANPVKSEGEAKP